MRLTSFGGVRGSRVSGKLYQMTGERKEAVEEAQPRREPEPTERPREVGGPKGPEPTRYGDWERAGRCIDF